MMYMLMFAVTMFNGEVVNLDPMPMPDLETCEAFAKQGYEELKGMVQMVNGKLSHTCFPIEKFINTHK